MTRGELTSDIFATWTYNLDQGVFLFYSEGNDDSGVSRNTHQESLQKVIETFSRISPNKGKSFSVLSAFAGSGDDSFLQSSGLFLSASPIVISGVTRLLDPKSLGYTSEPDRNRLIELLSAYEIGPTRNITHALKAPVNRIKGIAAILRDELGDRDDLEEFMDYLSSSADRLSHLAEHLLNIEPYPEQELITAEEVIRRSTDSTSKFIDCTVGENRSEHVFFKREHADALERLLINLLTHESEVLTGKQVIEVFKSDEAFVCIRLTQKLREKVAITASPSELDVELPPAGSLELLSTIEDALVVRTSGRGSLYYKIYLPHASVE